MIEERVERDREPIARRIRVPTRQPSDHALGSERIEHPRADVQGLVVVEEPDLGRLGRRGTLDRLALEEVGDGRRGAPHRLVEHAVDLELALQPDGLRDRRQALVLGSAGGGCDDRGAGRTDRRSGRRFRTVRLRADDPGQDGEGERDG